MPESGAGAKHNMAGPVQTCAIEDMQHDYFRIAADTPSSYQISLTSDPTPLYRVEVSQDPSAIADIQIFTAFTSEAPLAACRVTPKVNITKTARFAKLAKGHGPPLATVCTASPLSPTATWQPLHKFSSLSSICDYSGRIPLVMVPGCSPVVRNFAWRIGQTYNQALLELWLKGEGEEDEPVESANRSQLFARYYGHGQRQGQVKPYIKKRILEIRRGGGLEFEFAIVLQVIAILQTM